MHRVLQGSSYTYDAADEQTKMRPYGYAGCTYVNSFNNAFGNAFEVQQQLCNAYSNVLAPQDCGRGLRPEIIGAADRSVSILQLIVWFLMRPLRRFW